MSDEELEAYIKTIEPNFDSHLEKGTIEMSNEYYNLLEEKMARLINENQELKHILDEFEKWLDNFHKYSEFQVWEIKRKIKQLRGRDNVK